MSGLLLAIDPYIARLSVGANLGYFGPVNTTKIAITSPDPDIIVRPSKLRSTYGQALDSYSAPKPTEIELTFDDMAPDLLSMGLLGVPAAYTQADGTGASGSFTARHDRWVAIGKNNLSAFAITGKTEGTDFVVDLSAGLVKALSTGTIADAASTNYTASWPARSGKKIIANTTTSLQLALYGRGTNLFNQEDVDLEVYQANVAPSGALEFISSDPVSITLKGTLIVPAGKTGPYELRIAS